MPAPSKEDTLAQIQEKAKTSTDRFKIIVDRRPANGSLPMKVAGLDGATFAQIAEPAAWLPALLGGGEYYLKVFHSTDQPGMQIGSPLIEVYGTGPDSPAGAPKQTPSLRVMNSSAWPGPGTLFFPSKELIAADQLGAHPWEKNSSQKPNLGQLVAGEGLPQPQYDPNAQGLLAQAVAKEQEAIRLREETARRERDLTERETRVAKEQAERDAAIKRQESESKLRDEMRASNADLTNRLAAMATQLAAPREGPKGPNIAEIFTALSPLATQLITISADNARASRESAEKIAAAQRDASEKQSQLMMEVLKGLNAKPGMSDEMKMLIETLKDDKKNGSVDAMATMMSRMVDSVGVVSKMSIGMIETIANTMGGDPEDPVVTAIKEGVKAMQMLTQGTQAGAQRLIPGAQQRQAAPQQPQRPAQQAPRPQQPAPRPPAQNGGVPHAPQQPAVPPPPAGATATGPVAPVVQPQPAPQPAAGFAEMPPLETPPPETQADLVERAIRGKQDPDQIAHVIATLIAQKDPSFVEELSKNEGNPSALLGARLGEKWVGENMVYLKSLGDAFDKHGEALGIFDGDAEIPQEPEPMAAPLPNEAAPA